MVEHELFLLERDAGDAEIHECRQQRETASVQNASLIVDAEQVCVENGNTIRFSEIEIMHIEDISVRETKGTLYTFQRGS